MALANKVIAVRAKLAELKEQYPDGYCYLASLPTSGSFNLKGGQVIEVPLDNAAQHLVERTHRMAEPDEVEAWRAQQAKARMRIQANTPTDGTTLMVRGPRNG